MKTKKKIITIISISILLLMLSFIVLKKAYFKDSPIIETEESTLDVEMSEVPSVVDLSNQDNVELEDNEKVNNSKLLNSTHYLIKNDGGIKIKEIFLTDINLYSSEDRTIFEATLSNDSNQSYEIFHCVLDFYDNNNKILYELDYVDELLEVGETAQLSYRIPSDFTNSIDFEFLCDI